MSYLPRVWYKAVGANTGVFTSVACSDSLYVAGGDGKLCWSDNGKTWQPATGSFSNIYFKDIHYADNLWIACSSEGIWWSSDGKSWTQGTNGTNVLSDNFNEVSYGNGLWVAGSWQNIYWSSDGKIWNYATGFSRGCSFSAINFDGESWHIAFDDQYRNFGICSSSDGKEWIKSTTDFGQYNIIQSIAFGRGAWIACGNGIWISTNGTTWSPVKAFDEQGQDVGSSVAAHDAIYVDDGYDSGIWVVSSDNNMWVSTDASGSTFLQASAGTGVQAFLDICFDGNKTLAVCSTKGIWWSALPEIIPEQPIEMVWTQGTDASNQVRTEGIICNNGLWIACSDNGLWFSTIAPGLTSLVIDKFNVDGNTYDMEPVLDTAPVQDSELGVESGGVWTALKQIKDSISKSNVPVADSQAFFTAGGAWADKATGAVAGSTKVFTEKELYKYLRYILDSLGYTSVQIPASL